MNVAQEIANRIRAELVCCDVFERGAGLRDEIKGWDENYHALIEMIGDHDICYWGEAAALLAEEYR